MTPRRARIAAACAVGAAGSALAASCTLIDPASDFFDPEGTLVTIATLPTPPPALVLTADQVVFPSGSAIYAVPKEGGAPTAVASNDAGPIESIGSDRVSRVAWCQPAAGVFVWDETAETTSLVPGSTSCVSVAVSPGGLAFTTQTEDGGAAQQELVVQGAAGALERYPLPLASDSPSRVGLDDQGNYYVTESVFLARGVAPADHGLLEAGVPLGSPSCVVGRSTVPGAAVAIASAGDADVALVATETFVQATVQTTTCCRPGVDMSADCPVLGPGHPVAPTLLAVTGDHVLLLLGGHIDRYTAAGLASDAATGSLVRGQLGFGLYALAADDQYAYFMSYLQLQRLAYGGDGGD